MKNTSIYKADLGTTNPAKDLAQNFEAEAFREISLNEAVSIGFIPVREDSYEYIEKGLDHITFRVRIDTKSVPPSAIQKRAAQLAKHIKEITGAKISRGEMKELKAQAHAELLPRAIPRTTEVTCYHHRGTNYLFVPTASKTTADRILTLLVKAAGSIKTETIHISNVKHGLTTRLSSHIDGEFAFGAFAPTGEVTLVGHDGRISIKQETIGQAEEAIREALNSHHLVASLGLTHSNGTTFRLTHDFQLRAIDFTTEDEVTTENTPVVAEGVMVDLVSEIVTDLIHMIGHGEGEAA